MIGIFIAAGMGSRLAPLTDDCPKCMLPLDGQPILRRNIDLLRDSGVGNIYVITGYRREKIDFPDVIALANEDYRNNNILFSLMHARQAFMEAIEHGVDLVVSYSDIVYERNVVDVLVDDRRDFSLVADRHWRHAYVGRTEHPESEAEKIIARGDTVVRIGKHVDINPGNGEETDYEFIGLFKLSPRACRIWLDEYDALRERLSPEAPFGDAAEFRKSCLTNFFQHLIGRGERVCPVVIHGGWREFDTLQDYEYLKHVFPAAEISAASVLGR